MRSFVRVSQLSAARFAHVLGLFTMLALGCAVWPGSASADREACVSAHERAQRDRIEGHYLAARTALLTCAQRECPQLVSDECNTWLGELELTLPSVVFAVTDEHGRDLVDVRLTMFDAGAPAQALTHPAGRSAPVDGRALALDPGLYKLRFEAAGYAPVEQSLAIREGEKSRLVRITMAHAPSSPSSAPSTDRGASKATSADARSQRLWFASYALGTASVVSFAITLAAGTRGFRMLQHCAHDGCSDGYAAHGKSLYRTTNLSAITGGVFMAAAASTLWGALWRDGHSDERAKTERGLTGYADHHGATVTAWSRW